MTVIGIFRLAAFIFLHCIPKISGFQVSKPHSNYKISQAKYIHTRQFKLDHFKRSNIARPWMLTSCYSSTSTVLAGTKRIFNHGLAILRMPSSSADRIANEAILETALQHTNTLSVVLRSKDESPSLPALRRYVGEVYSMLWDCTINGKGLLIEENSINSTGLPNVVVYAPNLPNAAPESWICHRSDLDMVCSHDSLCGWFSPAASGRGKIFAQEMGRGWGGLDDHVAALNEDRKRKKLPPVHALHVNPWPKGACEHFQSEHPVTFLDDDILIRTQGMEKIDPQGEEDYMNINNADSVSAPSSAALLLGGARIDSQSLYPNVCVGGTFDGMHYGHRKLLTLAVSSVLPQTGRLLVGITVDEMLQNKQLSHLIPPLEERLAGVRDFLYRLAPGMKNRIQIVPIRDAYGPPGSKEEANQFDALVLSHETLENGYLLNQHRIHNLGLKPLVLLCTRRTEAYGMSSTALRKRRTSKSR
jgi:cytidyltransferase-like protein